MNYTKGEWKVYMTDIDKPRWEICARENGEIGVAKTIYDDDVPLKEKEANANLIAAAPDMYEALEVGKTVLLDIQQRVASDCGEALKVIDKALTKAEGREKC